jgi:hypothetical protein
VHMARQAVDPLIQVLSAFLATSSAAEAAHGAPVHAVPGAAGLHPVSAGPVRHVPVNGPGPSRRPCD